MDTLASFGEQDRLPAASMALVNAMARQLKCSRVSLGLVRGGKVQLQITSHTAWLRRSAAIVDFIEDAMEEALAQASPLVVPFFAGPSLNAARSGICLSHTALAKQGGRDAAVMSVLLPAHGEWPLGVLTMERGAGPAFSREDLALAQVAGTLVGPALRLQVRSNRWLSGRALDVVGGWIVKLVGPGRPALKLGATALCLALGIMAVATDTHRVGGRAVIEGAVQRAAVAPFDGFVLQAPARAGDVVKKGDLLAALDDRELVLEARKAWAEREKLTQRHQEAEAKHDRAGSAVLAAEIDQASASLALAEDRRIRARLVAPFDGVIISGDLSQMLGSPVERGKVLFEVAPIDRYRVSMQVDEENVRWVGAGQTGGLRLAGMPGRVLPFVVAQRAPVASTEDGRTVFKVEAMLSGDTDGLRPGMEGVGKIDIGSRNLLWSWFHPLFDAARLFIWKWRP
jgi:multidrug efflux pump subunit AcrA (membrane-fusion protein)